jgi:8-oxo-dGTP pyrophosphatase MutT (NUDIX family)
MEMQFRLMTALVWLASGADMDETKNPWTVLSRTTKYENDWIRVDHHEVLRPSGRPGIYGIVHFKNHATGVVPIDEKGNVILVGQYRLPLHAYSWEIPEGGGSHSVPVLESVQKELREECGLAAACWKEILNMDLSNSVTDERCTAFLAWELSPAPAQPDETEMLKVARTPFWEAVARVHRGEIRDAISVAALLRVALMALRDELPELIAKALGKGTMAG